MAERMARGSLYKFRLTFQSMRRIRPYTSAFEGRARSNFRLDLNLT